MKDGIHVVHDDELETAASTPGLHRRMAFQRDGYWFGHVVAEPETMSGWHHHGDTVTMGYVLKGEARLEFGPGGEQQVIVRAGDYFTVPPHTVHREGNASSEPGEIVLVRVGQGPPVFPLDGPDPA